MKLCSVGSERAQGADYFFNFVFLKEADAGYACGSGVEAGCGVFECDSAQGQDRNFCRAGFTQGGEACGLRSRRADSS